MPATKKKSIVNLQALINFLFIELKGTEDQIKADQLKAAGNLHYFLKWSDNAFAHASYHHWVGIYMDAAKNWLAEKKTLEHFRDHITKGLLHDSAAVQVSTNGAGNLMDAHDRASRARILNYINHAIHYNTFE